MAASNDIAILAGVDYDNLLRWEVLPVVYVPITAATQAAPCVLTCPAHGVPPGWRIAISGVKGMTQLNASNSPPKAKDYVQATVVDTNTLSLNTVNALAFGKYASSGTIQYNTPMDMTGFTAQFKVQNSQVDTTPLVDLSSFVTIDNTNKQILIALPAATTGGFTWSQGYYNFNMVSPSGKVYRLVEGNITVTAE